MADLLHSNLPSSSIFSHFSPLSFPLSFSTLPNFSIIRFAPLRRRFSQSSVLAKFSSDSSQFDIISRTEHSDGTVSFKFGDTSEISQTADILDSGNEVELEREGNSSVAREDNAVTDDDDESDTISSKEQKEIAIETADSLLVSQSDTQFCEDSVDEEQNSDLISTPEVKILTDLDTVKDEKQIVNDVVVICDSSVDVMSKKTEKLSEASVVMSDDEKVGYGGDVSSNLDVTSSDIEGLDIIVSLEDEVEKANDVSETSEETSSGVKLEHGGDALSGTSETSSDLEALYVVIPLENEIVEKVNEVSETLEETSSGAKLEGGGDGSPTGETSSDVEASDVNLPLENESVLDDIEKANEVSETLEETSSGAKFERGGDASSYTGETSSDVEASDVHLPLENEIVQDDIEKANEVSETLEETSSGAKLERGGDASSHTGETSSDVEASDVNSPLENEIVQDEIDKANEVSETLEETSSGAKLECGGDAPSHTGETSSDVEASDVNLVLENEIMEDELEKANEVSGISEETSSGVKLEHGGDASDSTGETSSDVEALDVVIPLGSENLEDEIEEDMVVTLVDEDDSTLELMSQGLETEPPLDEEASSNSLDGVVDLGSSVGFNKVANAFPPATEQSDVAPSIGDHLEESGPETSGTFLAENTLDSDLLEEYSPETSGMNLAETNLDSVDAEIATCELSMSSGAASLPLSSEVAEAGQLSIATLDDDPQTCHILDAAPPGIEESGITSAETNIDSLNIEDVSSGAALSPLSSEVNGASPAPVSQSVDDQQCGDFSPGAVPGPKSSGLASAKVSVQISTVANSLTPATGSSSYSVEVDDATLGDATSNDNVGGILVATGPVTSGMSSAETSLDSVNEVETSAPAFLISSAVASLADSLEALTGGKDAYFVAENWFGVADGVGQWSLGGVDMGLYAHTFMQNCENLLKHRSADITNVKELLRQSAAMTKSTGSARVLLAHVANQVLHVANIGDSGFVIIRNGIIFKKSSPMFHEFGFPYAIGLADDAVEDVEEYHIELEDGDVIVTATDGLFDNLYEQEITSIVAKAVESGMYIQELAELLATKAQEVGKSESARSPFADEAQAAGHPGYSGGKFDHVTVIVSLVQRR